MKSKKRLRLILCLCLSTVMLIGSAFAFLQASDTRTNEFVQGTLTISATEEEWYENDNYGTSFYPTSYVSWWPILTNPEDNIESWAFAEVKIPSTNEAYEYEDERPTGLTAVNTVLPEGVGDYYDLFCGEVTSDWDLVAIDTTHRNEPSGYTSYFFVHKTSLEPGEETELPPLELATANLDEKGNNVNYSNLEIQGLCIQKEGINNPYKAWAIFVNQDSHTSNRDYSNLIYCYTGFELNGDEVEYTS